jgi:hypothetical protein
VSSAEIEAVDPDPERAREFLQKAETFLADGEHPDLSLEASVVLYYQACLSAMDAVLTDAGRRVTSGTHSHAVRISECAGLLGEGYVELFDRMDYWRRERGDVSYAAVTPSSSTVAAIQADARDLVDAAAQFLG